MAELRCDGSVAAATLTEFINGDSDDPLSFRNGTRIFAACDARTRKPIGTHRAWQTAHEAVRRGASRPYDILQDNCHLFVAACAAGVLPDDPRFDNQLDGDVASIGSLERALEQSLNRGRRMSWCAVAQSKEEFNYKLRRMIASLAGALIYFISPVDLIPDWIPMAGFLDDAAILAAVFKLSETDLRFYRKWKMQMNAEESEKERYI